jgi:hypothetical protein
MNQDDLTRRDSERISKQETLQGGMLAKIAEAEKALDGIGEKHHVLFVGETVVNCRKLAGSLNMHPGFSCHYEEFGEAVPDDTGTIVLATHDLAVLQRVRERSNGAAVVIMSEDGVPAEVQELFPQGFVAWSFPAAFGHITGASKV